MYYWVLEVCLWLWLILIHYFLGIRAGKKFSSMKDLLVSSRSSSPIKERAGLTLSAMKSLVLREKEDKSILELSADEEVLSLLYSLFNAGRWLYGDPRLRVLILFCIQIAHKVLYYIFISRIGFSCQYFWNHWGHLVIAPISRLILQSLVMNWNLFNYLSQHTSVKV